jgi:hypothetical protein
MGTKKTDEMTLVLLSIYRAGVHGGFGVAADATSDAPWRPPLQSASIEGSREERMEEAREGSFHGKDVRRGGRAIDDEDDSSLLRERAAS